MTGLPSPMPERLPDTVALKVTGTENFEMAGARTFCFSVREKWNGGDRIVVLTSPEFVLTMFRDTFVGLFNGTPTAELASADVRVALA